MSHNSAFYCCISLTDLGERGPNSNCFFIKQSFGTISFYWNNGDSARDSVLLLEFDYQTFRENVAL